MESTRAKLKGAETVKLVDLVRADYVKSELDSVAFAKSINEDPEKRKHFRFDINASHTKSVLEATGIPNNYIKLVKAPHACSCMPEVKSLKERVIHLEGLVNILLKGTRT